MDDGPPSAAYVGIEAHASGRFWLAIVLTGLGTGASAAALMLILQFVQHLMWPEAGASLLDAASEATPWRHILVLVAAGLLTGAGQIVLVRLTSGNSIDITAAIWFSAGRLRHCEPLEARCCRSSWSEWALRSAAKARRSRSEL
ncbi:MAG TPA: hypothetical protein VJ226_08170 [Bradyrhizobium sp.]|nr:hypothetical protein [Bradyrhizobium sp.]